MRRPAGPKLTALPLLCLVLVTLAGCILEDPRASAVVLLDREALEGAPRLEQSGQGRAAGVPPLLVVPQAPIELRTDSKLQEFSVQPGELVYVHGPELELLRYVFDGDLDSDRLELVATREVADEVAAQMSAELTELGPEHFELGLTNAFVHLAQLAPSDVREVLPVLREGLAVAESNEEEPLYVDLPNALPGLDGDGTGNPVGTARELEAGLDPVGIYRCGDGQIVLDAAGRFRSCILGQPAHGRYSFEKNLITLDSGSGPRQFEISPDGALTGELGLRCGNARRLRLEGKL